jgi:hypothetical protein
MSSWFTSHRTSSEGKRERHVPLNVHVTSTHRSVITLAILSYVNQHVSGGVVHASIVILSSTEVSFNGVAVCNSSHDIIIEFEPLETDDEMRMLRPLASYLAIQRGIDERDIVSTRIISTVHEDGEQFVRARRTVGFLEEFAQIQMAIEWIAIVYLSMLREIIIVFESQQV